MNNSKYSQTPVNLGGSLSLPLPFSSASTTTIPSHGVVGGPGVGGRGTSPASVLLSEWDLAMMVKNIAHSNSTITPTPTTATATGDVTLLITQLLNGEQLTDRPSLCYNRR